MTICMFPGCPKPLPSHRRGSAPRWCSRKCLVLAARERELTRRARELIDRSGRSAWTRADAAVIVGEHHLRGVLDVVADVADLYSDGHRFEIGDAKGSPERVLRIPRTDVRGPLASVPQVRETNVKGPSLNGIPAGVPGTPVSKRGCERTTEGSSLAEGGRGGGGPSSTPDLLPSASTRSPRIVGLKLDGGTKLTLDGISGLKSVDPPHRGEVTVYGETFSVRRRGNYETSLIHGEATIILRPSSVDVVLSKEGLRTLGERNCCERWVDLATQLVKGKRCPSIAEAEQVGWRPALAEVALDVANLPLPESRDLVTKANAGARSDKNTSEPTWLCPTGIARPRDGLGVTIQDKSAWALSRKGGSTKKNPRELLDHPLEGRELGEGGLLPGERATRIEFHPSGLALQMHDRSTGENAGTGEVFYDVSTLSGLLDPNERRRVAIAGLRQFEVACSGTGPARSRPRREDWESLRGLVAEAGDVCPEKLARARLATSVRSLNEEAERTEAARKQAERAARKAKERLEASMGPGPARNESKRNAS